MNTPPYTAGLTLLTLAFLGGFWFLPGGVLALRKRAGGEIQVDVRLAYGPDTLYRLLHAYGRMGRRSFRRMLYVDMVFPIVYAATLCSYGGALTPSAGATIVKFAAILATASDYGENILLLAILRRLPTRSNPLARCAGICTTAKMLSFALSLVALVIAVGAH